MLKLISWNIAGRVEAWRELLSTGADIALLQEAAAPPPDVAPFAQCESAPWCSAGGRGWRTAVVGLSGGAKLERLPAIAVHEAVERDFAVSRLGTLAAARIQLPDGNPLTVISMYALWERPHRSTGSSWMYADASVHRLISDLSVLIGRQTDHRIIAAGDLNILYGYGENGSAYWKRRYATVFERMSALGLGFVGPQVPNGRVASPHPKELPPDSRNVPTFCKTGLAPADAARQLDFVFASTSLAKQVKVRAINEPADWGPSDHCKLEIYVGS